MGEIVALLGMHRSGTSLVAEILSANGIETGHHVVGGSRYNPRGHFEDRVVVNINKKLLLHFKGSWDAPPELPADWCNDPYALKLRESAAAYASQLLAERGRFFFKDPRTCLLLPFWQRAFGPMTYLVVMRSTDSIVNSLLRRQNDWLSARRMTWRWARHAYHSFRGACEPIRPLSAERARELVRQYHESLMRSLAGETVIYVVYEELLASPKTLVLQLLRSLGQASERAKHHIVRPELDHAKRRELASSTAGWIRRLRDAGCTLEAC